MEEIRDLIVKRMSYLLLPGCRNEDIKISPQGHIHLEDLIVWLTEDCGIMVEEEDVRKTVAAYMRDRVAFANDMIYARQYGPETSVSTIQARDVTESYMSDELQTKTGKRMSYLLRHGAHSESVRITPQGYITITDKILWLN